MDGTRFEEWEVACNDCESYWMNACDGVKPGTTKDCKSYKAGRKVVIPKQIEQLQTSVRRNFCIEIAIITYLVCMAIFQVL